MSESLPERNPIPVEAPADGLDAHRLVGVRLLRRLLIYHAALAISLCLAAAAFPDFTRQLPIGGVKQLVEGGVVVRKTDKAEKAELAANPIETSPVDGASSVTSTLDRLGSARQLSIILIGIWLLMLPVSWVHKGIHRANGDHSLDEAMLILPGIVAALVLVVQHSLALAFSLAGIVAGVQFRRSLQDTFDALFILVAIGAGIAAGIRALEIAGVLTVFFTYSTLYVHYFGDGLESDFQARKKRKRNGARSWRGISPRRTTMTIEPIASRHPRWPKEPKSMHVIARYRKATRSMMLVALLFCTHPACWLGTAEAAPAGGEKAKPEKIFATEATLSMTLTGAWRDFMREKSEKKRYQGTLEYVDESGAKRSVAVAFEPRGHNRLKVCKLPGIKLIFEKTAVEGTPFRGNKSLKLSTHCSSGERWEQYVVKEMLAYQIYNLVTERSFKVRPLSVTYVDTADRSPDGPHFGFLIEDDSSVAKRNHLKKIGFPKVALEQLDLLEASRFSLFEYLIGNTDFAQLNGPTPDRCCHNSVLMGENPQSKLYTVPYDFDSSGLVDAQYAVPSPVLKISSNRERVFRGFCFYNATLPTARGEILRLEPKILDLARADSRFTAGSRETVTDYLAKGFEVLRDDGKLAREVTAKCRK